ncbi:MAG: TAXI family TRAP transporter solute-binding subunit, partial [Rhodobacteraceae bacterium]|nr:TAXI family TRAP transporter solute-binding subunit [Paracoccaceae bacterium]
SGLGNAALKDLSANQKTVFVSIPAEIAEKLGAPYTAGVIPAGTYPGQDADVPTVGIVNFLVTRSDVSDETAYEMTKLLFEKLDTLKAAHSAANGISIEGAVQALPLPLHPGAEKYYKEMGILK